MRLAKGSASVWSTASHITNPFVVQMGSSTKTTVSSIALPVLEDAGLPSCTARSASIKVRPHVTCTSHTRPFALYV
ncbi:hypothetical protein LDENG_00217600 [Lucifuga dentata]|nr:hypothetical protein LDENG_00217600 [Lucifuga dentata]